ncbi:MAG: hypothetical protein ACRDA5_06380, partial [Clostridium sp.]
ISILFHMSLNGGLYAIERKFISVPLGIDSIYVIIMALIIIVVAFRIYVKMLKSYNELEPKT